MKTTILAALLLSLAACGSDASPMCDDASSISRTPTEVSCFWQCTTRDGHPVVLAWETYELQGPGYVLTGSETLAGFCLE